MQVTKRTFLKGLLATAAAGGGLSLRLPQNLRPTFPQNGTVKRTSLFSVTAVQALPLLLQPKMPVQMSSSLKKQLRAAATQLFPPAA
ncbi:hypothetical protein [Parasutterella excrementihominis]